MAWGGTSVEVEGVVVMLHEFVFVPHKCVFVPHEHVVVPHEYVIVAVLFCKMSVLRSSHVTTHREIDSDSTIVSRAMILHASTMVQTHMLIRWPSSFIGSF